MDKISRILIWNEMQKKGLDYDDLKLHASSAGYLDVLKTEVTNFKTANSCNAFGTTILHAACENHNVEGVKFLLSQEAEIDDYNEYGMSPLMSAFRIITTEDSSNEIIFNDFKDTIDYLLINNAKAKSSSFRFIDVKSSAKNLKLASINMLYSLADDSFRFYERKTDKNGREIIEPMVDYKRRVYEYLKEINGNTRRFGLVESDYDYIKENDINFFDIVIADNPHKASVLKDLRALEALDISVAIDNYYFYKQNIIDITEEQKSCSDDKYKKGENLLDYSKEEMEESLDIFNRTLKSHTTLSKFDSGFTYSVPSYPYYFIRAGYDKNGTFCLRNTDYFPTLEEFNKIKDNPETSARIKLNKFNTVDIFDESEINDTINSNPNESIAPDRKDNNHSHQFLKSNSKDLTETPKDNSREK